MNCLIKKRPYKTDNSHILSGKTHTFHMNMLLILLNYHLINVFFDLPGVYTVLIKKIFFLQVKHNIT